jgi:hypothetical protein
MRRLETRHKTSEAQLKFKKQKLTEHNETLERRVQELTNELAEKQKGIPQQDEGVQTDESRFVHVDAADYQAGEQFLRQLDDWLVGLNSTVDNLATENVELRSVIEQLNRDNEEIVATKENLLLKNAHLDSSYLEALAESEVLRTELEKTTLNGTTERESFAMSLGSTEDDERKFTGTCDSAVQTETEETVQVPLCNYEAGEAMLMKIEHWLVGMNDKVHVLEVQNERLRPRNQNVGSDLGGFSHSNTTDEKEPGLLRETTHCDTVTLCDTAALCDAGVQGHTLRSSSTDSEEEGIYPRYRETSTQSEVSTESTVSIALDPLDMTPLAYEARLAKVNRLVTEKSMENERLLLQVQRMSLLLRDISEVEKQRDTAIIEQSYCRLP